MLMVVIKTTPLIRAYIPAKTLALSDKMVSLSNTGPMPLRIIEALRKQSYQSNEGIVIL